jgi:hypothetical protein
MISSGFTPRKSAIEPLAFSSRDLACCPKEWIEEGFDGGMCSSCAIASHTSFATRVVELLSKNIFFKDKIEIPFFQKGILSDEHLEINRKNHPQQG